MTEPESKSDFLEREKAELLEMSEAYEQLKAMNNPYKPNRAERRAASKNSRKAARKQSYG